LATFAYRTNPGRVWRVGWEPDPWAWSDWKYASDEGRFDGRWDDEASTFRTVYAGSSLFACYLEILAKHRPDSAVDEALGEIAEDPADAADYPPPPEGLGYSWLEGRMVGEATLSGAYCQVTASQSIARLRPIFLEQARLLGAADFDASILKDSAPRHLTRSIARWIYDHAMLGADLVDGIEFRSRHGDELTLWAIFERDFTQPVSPLLADRGSRYVDPDEPELVRAMALFAIAWA
jgi:hypothetical protein